MARGRSAATGFCILDGQRIGARFNLGDIREGRALIAEWPENAGDFTTEPACLAIALEVLDKTSGSGRIAIVEGGSDWLERMPCL